MKEYLDSQRCEIGSCRFHYKGFHVTATGAEAHRKDGIYPPVTVVVTQWIAYPLNSDYPVSPNVPSDWFLYASHPGGQGESVNGNMDTKPRETQTLVIADQPTGLAFVNRVMGQSQDALVRLLLEINRYRA